MGPLRQEEHGNNCKIVFLSIKQDTSIAVVYIILWWPLRGPSANEYNL